MLTSVDPFLDRVFEEGRYNCLHFTREVWRAIDGEIEPWRLTRLARPRDPCLVLLVNPKARPHAGVYIRGRLLHLTRAGVEYQPLEIAALFFKEQRFFAYD